MKNHDLNFYAFSVLLSTTRNFPLSEKQPRIKTHQKMQKKKSECSSSLLTSWRSPLSRPSLWWKGFHPTAQERSMAVPSGSALSHRITGRTWQNIAKQCQTHKTGLSQPFTATPCHACSSATICVFPATLGWWWPSSPCAPSTQELRCVNKPELYGYV